MRLKKRFGQNFLRDENIVKKILHTIAAKKEDHLVEIGAGSGVLTKHLINKASKFDVIELDRDLIPILNNLCRNDESCVVHQYDVLEFDFKNIFSDKKMRIIGNLPYNISTPLIFHLIDHKEYIEDMHFMLQKEVAERLASKPGSKQYGRLSVMAQYHLEVKTLFNVPPQAFTPIPKVESAFVRLTPITKQIHVANDPVFFSSLVKKAFCHRRKTIRNSLKSFLEKKDLGSVIDLNSRPEQLSVSDFVNLSNCLHDTSR